MINLRFTFVKIIVIQPSGCKGNFNKTIYLSKGKLSRLVFKKTKTDCLITSLKQCHMSFQLAC